MEATKRSAESLKDLDKFFTNYSKQSIERHMEADICFKEVIEQEKENLRKIKSYLERQPAHDEQEAADEEGGQHQIPTSNAQPPIRNAASKSRTQVALTPLPLPSAKLDHLRQALYSPPQKEDPPILKFQTQPYTWRNLQIDLCAIPQQPNKGGELGIVARIVSSMVEEKMNDKSPEYEIDVRMNKMELGKVLAPINEKIELVASYARKGCAETKVAVLVTKWAGESFIGAEVRVGNIINRGQVELNTNIDDVVTVDLSPLTSNMLKVNRIHVVEDLVYLEWIGIKLSTGSVARLGVSFVKLAENGSNMPIQTLAIWPDEDTASRMQNLILKFSVSYDYFVLRTSPLTFFVSSARSPLNPISTFDDQSLEVFRSNGGPNEIIDICLDSSVEPRQKTPLLALMMEGQVVFVIKPESKDGPMQILSKVFLKDNDYNDYTHYGLYLDFNRKCVLTAGLIDQSNQDFVLLSAYPMIQFYPKNSEQRNQRRDLIPSRLVFRADRGNNSKYFGKLLFIPNSQFGQEFIQLHIAGCNALFSFTLTAISNLDSFEEIMSDNEPSEKCQLRYFNPPLFLDDDPLSLSYLGEVNSRSLDQVKDNPAFKPLLRSLLLLSAHRELKRVDTLARIIPLEPIVNE
jgi:hypothetical protein